MQVTEKVQNNFYANYVPHKYTVNRPLGKTWNKYEDIWRAYINDMIEGNNGIDISVSKNQEEENEQIQKLMQDIGDEFVFYSIVRKTELNQFFGGLIRDWDYLLNFLNDVSRAKFKYPDKNAFVYEIIDENTVSIRLGIAGFSIE